MSDIRPVRLSGVRGLIAQKMTESITKTAQLSFFCDVDATQLDAARNAYRSDGKKVGYEDLMIKAITETIPSFPLFNALEKEGGIEPQSSIHVSCAIASPAGLVAPAIFNADQLTVEQIASAREDLVSRSKQGKLTVTEMTGGTITVSNLGLTRVQHFTPILNYPQQAIIGLGQIARRPWVADDGSTIIVRPVMGLSLTVDHRVIDGFPAGQFLSALAQAIEQFGAGGSTS